ncbi:MAG: hypothetical protein MR224_05410 [Dorea sp.]|nr:hypothetical protein [Dorea sp.]MDY2813659.1 hypothetical protein [Dorea sp.]
MNKKIGDKKEDGSSSEGIRPAQGTADLSQQSGTPTHSHIYIHTTRQKMTRFLKNYDFVEECQMKRQLYRWIYKKLYLRICTIEQGFFIAGYDEKSNDCIRLETLLEKYKDYILSVN